MCGSPGRLRARRGRWCCSSSSGIARAASNSSRSSTDLRSDTETAADFVGVIDGGGDEARAFAGANKVPYRVLADPDRTIIARFEAKHGGYVVLLDGSGHVDVLWPGCSAEMLRSLGRRIAALGAQAERPIDLDGMPKVLTTGCPFAS